MAIGGLLPIGKFTSRFGPNENFRAYPLLERGDERHSSARKQFHNYDIVLNKICQAPIRSLNPFFFSLPQKPFTLHEMLNTMPKKILLRGREKKWN